MKRGRRELKKNNIYIYFGTILFVIFALILGISIYILNNKSAQSEEKIEQINEEQLDEYEDVTTEIGKTVEEQQNSNTITENVENTSNESTNKIKNNSLEEKNQVDEPDTNTEKETSNTESKEVTEVKKEISFAMPVEGDIICGYAKDNLIYSETLKEWITHTAIDIKADKTSVVKAAADGTIRSIVNDPRYGLTVVIEHDDGYETIYSNLLTAEFVVEGEDVKQGQTIGTAGNTASFESEMDSHIHFEILKDGEYVDPSIYLK